MVLSHQSLINTVIPNRTSKSFICLLLGILLYLIPGADALTQHNNYIYYSVNEGLSQASVYKIMQDSRGYIWLGTGEGGVSRFDGRNFMNLDQKDGLPGVVIRDIIEDSRGWIWIGTENGIAVYDGYTFSVINKDNGLSGQIITVLYEDSRGMIWAGTGFGGLNRIVVLEKGKYSIDKISEEEGLSSYQVWSIQEDVHGRLWIGLPAGLNVIRLSGNSYTIDHLGNYLGIPEDVVYAIESDDYGNLWFGTADSGAYRIEITDPERVGEIIRFDSESGLTNNTIWDIYSFEDEVWFGTGDGILYIYSRKEDTILPHGFGLDRNEIFDIFQDSEKNIWLGTNGRGVCKLLGKRFSHYTNSDGLPGNIINGIIQDNAGDLWLASYDEGLIRMSFNGEEPQFENFTTEHGLASNSLNGLTIDEDGIIWIATRNNGFSEYDGNRFRNYSLGEWLVDNEVNCILVDDDNTLWLGTNTGIVHYDGEGYFLIDQEKGLPFNEVRVLSKDRSGNIWIGTYRGLARYDKHLLFTFDESDGLPTTEIAAIAEDENGIMWIGTANDGIYRYNPTDDDPKFERTLDQQDLNTTKISSLTILENQVMIAGSNRGFYKLWIGEDLNVRKIINYDVSDGFFGIENNPNAVYKDNQGMVWFGTINGISRYNPTFDLGYRDPPKIHFSGLDLFYETIDWTTRTDSVLPFTGMPEYLKLKYTDNHLTFRFQGLYYTNPQKIRYQYMLEGREVDWSPPVTAEEVTYSGLLPGDYVFHVRSGIALEEWSGNPLRFAFTIKPPFYKTWWFIIILVFITLVAIASYIKYREKQLILEKRVLEEKVEERTREIRKQKSEIEEKNRYLSEANEEITLQKEIIEKKNIDITDSIKYAKRIQDAVLPSEKILKQYLVDSFILFKPKDIVSGDFYWVKEKEDLLIVVAADCTGHGVPGAFMSLLGITFLNEIVEKNNITSPEKILNQLRENVITSLKQKGLDSESKDGMDIAICTINRKNHQLEYSGANNPMYYIRNDRLIMVKADRMPVAIHARMKDFTKNEVSLKPGDTVYLFSDGYADQFGGPDGKKLKYKAFQEILLEIQKESMASQKEILNKKHLEWRGIYEQIDDIVVLGFKV